MPYKDPEKNKESKKQYYESVKGTEEYKIKQSIATKKWRLNNQKQYTKSNRISKWKRRGIIFYDYDLLHDIYINTTHCDLCKVELTEDKIRTRTTRCLDHDHNIKDYENVRNILCHSCNTNLK